MSNNKTKSLVQLYIELLLKYRDFPISTLAKICGTKTYNLERSLSGVTVSARTRYIPCIVALLRLSKAETEVIIEYAGVFREYDPQNRLILCCRDIHRYLDEYDNYAPDGQIVVDLNDILKKYGFPLISE